MEAFTVLVTHPITVLFDYYRDITHSLTYSLTHSLTHLQDSNVRNHIEMTHIGRVAGLVNHVESLSLMRSYVADDSERIELFRSI